MAPAGAFGGALRGPAQRSEWVLRFWEADGTEVGAVRNRTGLRIDELMEEELCVHLADARRHKAPESFSDDEGE